MAEKTADSDTSNEVNTVLGAPPPPQEQTPDQFYDGTSPDDDKPPPKDHATKGMVSLGYSEASRIEDTAEAQEADREAAEKAAPKE